MRNLRPIAICIVAHIFAGWIIINFLTPHYSGYLGSLNWIEEEAIKHHSIIASYKTKSSGKTIWIERLQLRLPWKYVFYTPKFYTNIFYTSSDPYTEAEISYVTSGHDTDRFSFVPEVLVVHLRKNTDTIVYSLDHKYQENIDKMPDVPFSEKIDAGPFLNDDD